MSGGSYSYKFCEVDDYYVGARLKPIIDRRINEVRTELINMMGGDDE